MNVELTENDKIVLETVRRHPGSKKTRISELAGIPWASTSASIEKLTKINMFKSAQDISESEKNTINIANEYAYLIGVSVGTSHIKVCVLDFSFKCVEKTRVNALLNEGSVFRSEFWQNNGFSSNSQDDHACWCATTPCRGLLDVKKLMNDICNFATELCGEDRVISLGFSFPGHIDNKNSIIIKSSNLNFDLNNVSIGTLFTSETQKKLESFNINVYLEHNVKAAAIAERTIGVLKNIDANSAVMYFGTGLGIAFYFNGRLYRGESNASGQIGHIKSVDDDHNLDEAICTCGQKGCLEQKIRNLFVGDKPINEMTGEQIAQVLNNNTIKKRTFVNYLSNAIFNMANILEINNLVFAAKLGDVYYSIEDMFQERLIENNRAQMRIMPSNLKEYSASFGSAIGAFYARYNYDF